MKVLAGVLVTALVLAWGSPMQAGVIVAEDFEGAAPGTPVNGYNGWTGPDNILISSNVIDQGQSADASGGADPAWPKLSKAFAYTPAAGEYYVFTGTVYAPGTGGEYGHIQLSNGAGTFAQAMLGYNELIFALNENGGELFQVRVAQSTDPMDVMLVLKSDRTDFYYRLNGTTAWNYAGGDTQAVALSAYTNVEFYGHGGYAGGVDSIVLEAVPEPVTLTLLAAGGWLASRRRK